MVTANLTGNPVLDSGNVPNGNYMNNTAVGNNTASASFTYPGGGNYQGSNDTTFFSITSGTTSGEVDFYLPTYNNGIIIKPLPGTLLSGQPTPLPAPFSPVTSATSGGDGTYSITDFGIGAYNITASKTTQACGTGNGINSNDASMVSQHVVGLITLDPAQVAAGKVANLPALSSFDAALIAQKVVALCTVNNHSGEWRFNAPNPLGIPDGQMNWTNQNFRGYMMGDVDGSWSPAGGNRPAVPHEGPANAVTASLPHVSAQTGTELVVPFSINNLAEQGITSYQIDINYDPAVLSPEQAAVSISGTNSDGMGIAFNAAEPGLIKVAVYGAFPVTGDGVYANLRFTVVGAAGSVSPLTISDFRFNDASVGVVVTDGEVTVGGADNIIRGHVLSPTGQPVPNVKVVLASILGRGTRVAVTDAEGRFQVGSLTPGSTYTLNVQTVLYRFLPVTVSLTQPVIDVDLTAVSVAPPKVAGD